VELDAILRLAEAPQNDKHPGCVTEAQVQQTEADAGTGSHRRWQYIEVTI
jgi:hypothetical protein